MKEKSKILKLKKKYNKYRWLEKKFNNILLTIGSLAGLGMISSIIFNSLLVAIISSSLFALSVSVSATFLFYLKDLFNKKRAKIDDKIENLIKLDAEEKQILDEYMAIQKIKKESKQEIKDKKNLITRLIHKKNFEAKEYNSLVKSLTKQRKAEAEQQVIEDLERYKNNKNVEAHQQTAYSHTKAAKVYAEKTKEQQNIKGQQKIVQEENIENSISIFDTSM